MNSFLVLSQNKNIYINTAVMPSQLRWMSQLMHINHHPGIDAPLGGDLSSCSLMCPKNLSRAWHLLKVNET